MIHLRHKGQAEGKWLTDLFERNEEMKSLMIALLIINGLGLGVLIAWPKKSIEPNEVMTLLIWGSPNEDIGTVEWIHGKANNEQALRWKVWQPSNYVLKYRFVIEGKPIND